MGKRSWAAPCSHPRPRLFFLFFLLMAQRHCICICSCLWLEVHSAATDVPHGSSVSRVRRASLTCAAKGPSTSRAFFFSNETLGRSQAALANAVRHEGTACGAALKSNLRCFEHRKGKEQAPTAIKQRLRKRLRHRRVAQNHSYVLMTINLPAGPLNSSVLRPLLVTRCQEFSDRSSRMDRRAHFVHLSGSVSARSTCAFRSWHRNA